MALNISKPSEYGSPAVYWRVVMVNFDARQKAAQILVNGFHSKEYANQEGSKPLSVASVVVRDSSYEQLASASVTDPRIPAYVMLKALPQFSGATDI